MNKKVFAVLHCIYLCCSGNQDIRDCGKSVSRPEIIRPETKAIIGGDESSPGDYPWMVSLQFGKGSSHFCAGSMINENWILTAAHCTETFIFRPSDLQAVAGLYKISETGDTVQILKISKIVQHEGYDDSTMMNDIALLKTVLPVNNYGSGGYVNGICLPSTDSEPFGIATVIGWGQVEYPNGPDSDELREVIVPIINRQTCNETYVKTTNGSVYLGPNMICAGMENRDSCVNDSGGPLFQTDVGESTIIGIVSYGIGCGQVLPGVYTKVSAYVPWIEKVIAEN